MLLCIVNVVGDVWWWWVVLGVIVVIDMMGVLFIVSHYCLVVFVWFYGGVLGLY